MTTGVCKECGEPFEMKTKRRRFFCSHTCTNKPAQRRYRAKPETRAKINKRARVIRARIKANE